MITNGIRIFDEEENGILISLSQLLSEVLDGSQFYWTILYLDAIGKPDVLDFLKQMGVGDSLPEFEDRLRDSPIGYPISWFDLITLASKLHQAIDIVAIGSKDKTLLHQYESDRMMYETCDISVVIFDSSYCEVFSQTNRQIEHLKNVFRNTESLTSDMFE